MPTTQPPIGILLMAYGGPDSLDDVEPYLLDIRGGRPTPPELVEEIKERYALIGGRSPLLDITREQAAALAAYLNQEYGDRFRAYVGMRHWQPRIKEAVAQMANDGIKRAVALVMAPHYSQMSTGAYFKRLDEAVNDLGVGITFARVKSWHNHPGLIAALTEKAKAAMERFAGDEIGLLHENGDEASLARVAEPGRAAGDDSGQDRLKPRLQQVVYFQKRSASPWEVVFTAHSLPTRILDQGDPYDAQLRETATLLAEQLGLSSDRWLFCYQSAGRSPEPWLGPQIEDVIVELAQAGEKHLLVVPIGFVCDHVEVLYDIDIEARQLAEAHGTRLERSESLNTSPTFITALADLVKREA